MTDSCVLAVDVGGSAVKAAVVDADAAVHHSSTAPTDLSAGADSVVAQVTATVRDLETTARAVGRTPVAVGVVVPGLVDADAGIAAMSANLGWRDVPMRQRLRDRIALPLAFGHDVRAGGLAEAVLGAGRGTPHHLFVAIGTGISAALVVDGQPYDGSGYAGELGHVVVDQDGPVCGCGATGCLEAVASAAAIARRYATLAGDAVDAAEVLARAGDGDRVAETVVATAVDGIAAGLAMATSLLAPQRVVVGGGLAAAGEQLLAPLRSRLRQRLTFQHLPQVVAAQLGERAGCLGAGLLAWHQVGTGSVVPA